MREIRIARTRGIRRKKRLSYELGIHLQLQWEVDEATTTAHKAH